MPGELRHPNRLADFVVIFTMLAGVVGCGSPNSANIELRRQNQELGDQIATLKSSNEGLRQSVAALESHATTVPILPQDRLDQLFTAQDLKFGRLTGGADLDESKPGDEGLKVYLVPVDGQGESLKAAGAFKVEAFDLSDPEHSQIGTWEFPIQDAAKNWYGQALLHTYVLTCPWQTPPTHEDLTIKVTFTDALTQRQITKQMLVKAKLPPAAAK